MIKPEECIICSIIAGSTKSYNVFENERFLAFLDIRPLFPGHCLIVPKKHIVTFYELPKVQIGPYFAVVQLIGKAIEKSMQAQGSFIGINNIVSQSIPHLHTHIAPRNQKDGLKGFFWPRVRYENEEKMQEIQKSIKKSIAELQNV